MAHMIPVAEFFTSEEARKYIYSVWELEAGEAHGSEAPSGWFSRLSAPGYLDATDWSGPFESEKEALDEIMELYDVDENGNENS